MPVYVHPLKLPKTVFAGTTTIAIAHSVKLVPYYMLGQLNPHNLEIATILAVPASIAVFAGVRLVRIVPKVMFYRLITWALLAISLKLIWAAANGL